MFLDILFLLNKTNYKFMTFLEFLNKQPNKVNESKVEAVLEGFKSSDVAKAHELMLSIFKKKISGGKILYDKNPVTTKIGNDTCESFTFMKVDGTKISNMWTINYLKNGDSNEVYSIDFFDNESSNEILFGSGKAKANLSIYTLGSSVAYFIPIICHVVNNNDYSLNTNNANKEASKIFANSPKNECLEYTYYYGAQKYKVLENIDNETIEEAFNYNLGLVLEASEAQDYRWKVKKERDEAYKKRKEDPERHERLRQEYEEIVNAIRGGATSIKDLKMAIKHDMLVSFDGEGVDEAQEKINVERDDPKTAFKKMGVYIKSVIKGLQPGVILCGAPGIGKTYRVKQYLKAYGYNEGHNLYTIKDDDGNVVLYRIEIVTTPFKKDDIKVRLSENNILTIQCGNENFHHEDEKHLTYRGISSQSYSFSLRLSNFIDCKNITAHNQDGILRIDMPVSMNESEPQEITIQ